MGQNPIHNGLNHVFGAELLRRTGSKKSTDLILVLGVGIVPHGDQMPVDVGRVTKFSAVNETSFGHVIKDVVGTPVNGYASVDQAVENFLRDVV